MLKKTLLKFLIFFTIVFNISIYNIPNLNAQNINTDPKSLLDNILGKMNDKNILYNYIEALDNIE